ncbi:MAG: butyrate kinase, partial [Vagococcus sp.]
MEAILVINPGSTSTKTAIFADHNLIAEETIRHTVDEISQFSGVIDQADFRYDIILSFVEEQGLKNNLVAVVGRGGLLKPIPGGTYNVG